MATHLKGVGHQSTASRTALGGVMLEANQTAGQPVQQQDHIDYGVVTDVNIKNNQVKVRLFEKDIEIKNGAFLPLINPLSQIHLTWGMLRKGLVCRVHWRGKQEPQDFVLVEIVGDETVNFLKKDQKENELTTGPYKIFSGGVGAL